ncbi:hypothetical protein BpHYR1_001947 [Brachionus plicatilis]|uniref:ATP-dependent DNA helicase n=1 Tax=Brachionus plicatilis TaxID=10195 RepID=A0A3M7PDD1_BRAPC|nr:hypothetical protein BpHYR1_001947 [Brachionus plicatilis]
METITYTFMLLNVIDNSITLCSKRILNCPVSCEATTELEKQFKNLSSFLVLIRGVSIDLEYYFNILKNLPTKSGSPPPFYKDIKIELDGFEIAESGDATNRLLQQLSFSYISNAIDKIGAQTTIGQELASLSNEMNQRKLELTNRSPEEFENSKKKARKRLSCPQIIDFNSEILFLSSNNVNAIINAETLGGEKSGVDVIRDPLQENNEPTSSDQLCFETEDSRIFFAEDINFELLYHRLRHRNLSILPTAFTGIASELLIGGGQTRHSKFKIPIPTTNTSVSAALICIQLKLNN